MTLRSLFGGIFGTSDDPNQSAANEYENQLGSVQSSLGALGQAGRSGQGMVAGQAATAYQRYQQFQDQRATPARNIAIQRGEQAQNRDLQMGLSSQLQQQAAGAGPSVAEAQYRRDQSAVNRNILAAAAAARGGASPASQSRNLLNAQGAAGLEAANQAAQIRAQEMLNAREQLAGLSTNARAQDIGLAQAQAGLQQQTELANQAAENQLQAQKGQLGLGYSQLGMNAAQYNAGLGLQASQDQVQTQYALLQQMLQKYGIDTGQNISPGQLLQFGGGLAQAAASAGATSSDARNKEGVKGPSGGNPLTAAMYARTGQDVRVQGAEFLNGTGAGMLAAERYTGPDMSSDWAPGTAINRGRGGGVAGGMMGGMIGSGMTLKQDIQGPQMQQVGPENDFLRKFQAMDFSGAPGTTVSDRRAKEDAFAAGVRVGGRMERGLESDGSMVGFDYRSRPTVPASLRAFAERMMGSTPEPTAHQKTEDEVAAERQRAFNDEMARRQAEVDAQRDLRARGMVRYLDELKAMRAQTSTQASHYDDPREEAAQMLLDRALSGPMGPSRDSGPSYGEAGHERGTYGPFRDAKLKRDERLRDWEETQGLLEGQTSGREHQQMQSSPFDPRDIPDSFDMEMRRAGTSTVTSDKEAKEDARTAGYQKGFTDAVRHIPEPNWDRPAAMSFLGGMPWDEVTPREDMQRRLGEELARYNRPSPGRDEQMIVDQRTDEARRAQAQRAMAEAYARELAPYSTGRPGQPTIPEQWRAREDAAGFRPGGNDVPSDEQLKEGKREEHPEIEQFLDQLHPFTWRYKDPERYGQGRRAGIMAQELEKTELGEGLVHDTPEGKVVESGGLANAALAAGIENHRRLDTLEDAVRELDSKRGRRKKGR